MSEPASSPHRFFANDHRQCDEAWSKLETALDAGELSSAQELWQQFDASMRNHFRMEEEVLFPALEAVAPHAAVPIAVMRAEHDQMRGVLDQMAEDVARGEIEGLLDLGDTLLMLTQQHNIKEENVLYPIADQTLSDQWHTLIRKLH